MLMLQPVPWISLPDKLCYRFRRPFGNARDASTRRDNQEEETERTPISLNSSVNSQGAWTAGTGQPDRTHLIVGNVQVLTEQVDDVQAGLAVRVQKLQ